MKIDTLRVRNFRCYKENLDGEWGIIFRPNRDLNLIIGSNGSGKTAMLDALDIVMNVEGRSNQSLVSEYDFPYCDTTKAICIEVTLVDLGQALGEFEWDIQWIDPEDGMPIEAKNIDLDGEKHRKAVVIRFEAALDPEDGEIKWRWFLPKFPETEMEEAKELSRAQHASLGYFRIRPAVTAGAFTLGQYSVLGRHLRKLQYRLGKLPEYLRSVSQLPKCSLERLQCDSCPYLSDCIPTIEEEGLSSSKPGNVPTIGSTLERIISGARGVLGSHGWNQMNVSLGPRYGGIGSSLAALTLGLRTSADEKPKFIPFERLSAGEKYSLSFALARAQVPGEQPPVILMEEPETALHPSAVATLLGDLQAIPVGEAPQIITSSHSESVLRCFSTEDVCIIGGDRQPRRLKAVIERVKPAGGPLVRTEYLIMPGGPSALFAEKILIVEGAQDAIVSGYLDRLAAKISAVKRSTYLSFSSLGWCIFETSKANWAQASADILSKLGKQVAILLDGDGPGKDAAVKTKDICPTFVYHSKTSSNPTLEDALLLGLPQKQKDEVLDEFLAHPECSTCDNKEKKCWKQKGGCELGDINYRKTNLQDLCLKCYLENQLFPPAFKALLSQLDSAEAGTLYQLPIDAQVDALTV